jgi:hypothetical protein
MRGNWSPALLAFIVLMLVAVFVGLPWLIRHPPHHRHDELKGRSLDAGRAR